MQTRIKGLRFRPRWWGGLLALAACSAAIALGNWQTRRAQEKHALAERFEQAARTAPASVPSTAALPVSLVFKRLAAKGEFVPRFTILLDNKVYHGRPGYFVVTPLRLSGSAMHVLVNRGWIAAGSRREDLPSVRTPPGEVAVEGLGLEHAPRVLAVGGPPTGRVWQGLAIDEFSRWSGLAVQPVFLEQRSDTPDGLVRDWPAPDFGIDRHTSYAMQWYLIAALAVVIFVSLSFDRVRPPAG
jgi:surfeit locus 1 family protein